MINFGDQVGQTIFCKDEFVYTYSGEELLILSRETMKVVQRINVGAQIQTMAINTDIFVLTMTSVFLQYTLEGKLLQSKQHKQKVFYHPHFSNNHFICHNRTNFLRVGMTCSKIYDAQSTTSVNCIQYSEYKEQIVIADDKRILIIGEEEKVLKQFTQPVTILKLDESQDILACGLANGQLVLLKYSTGTILQQDHWHAHAINCMVFEGTSLYTAGEEGVIVQWHLGVARKAFFPRQGGEIVAICSAEDILIVNLKGINQVKQISLMGQNILPSFNGIHSITPTSFLNYQNKFITVGVLGQLQIINPSQGTLLQTVPISHKNYTSNSANQTSIQQIMMLDRFLICVLKSSLKQSLQFFENTHNFEFQLVASVDYIIDGIDASHMSVVTWGNGEVRMWRQLKQKNGQFNWNCVFRGDGYKGRKIIAVHLVDENNLIIVTVLSILTVNTKNNQITKEIPLDEINPEAAYIYPTGVLVCNGRQITLYQETKKIIGTVFTSVKSIHRLNENHIALHYDDQYGIVMDLKQQHVVHAFEAKILITTAVAGKTVLYSYDNYQYKYLTVLSTERKASLVIEEQETAHFDNIDEPERPIISTENHMDTNIYRRLQLAKQLRQIKELNLKDFLVPQSHLLPSLTFLAERVTNVLRQDFSEQQQQPPSQIIELEDNQKSQSNLVDNLEIQKLKKLFK